MVVVDRFTKYSHFVPLSHPYSDLSVAQAFVDNIVKLHGPPKLIISDKDMIFTSKLWKDIFARSRNLRHAYQRDKAGRAELTHLKNDSSGLWRVIWKTLADRPNVLKITLQLPYDLHPVHTHI